MNLTSPTVALVRREVRGSLLRWRTLALVVCWIVASLLATVALWPAEMTPGFAFQQASRMLVSTLTAVLVIGISMTVPALAAVSIAAERDEDTFDLLRLTLLSNRSLVRAKILSSVVIAVFFIVAVFPVLSVVQFLVGLDNTQILQLLLYVLLYTAMCACIGVACSTSFRRPAVAIAISYAILILPLIVPFITRLFSLFRGNIISYAATSLLSPIHYFDSIIARSLNWFAFAAACAIPLAVCTIAAFVARHNLVRMPEPAHSREGKPIDDQAELHARRTRFPYYLIDPLRRKPVIPDHRNPMVIREIRWGLFIRTTWMVRAFYVTFILMFFPVIVSSVNLRDDPIIYCLCAQMTLMILATPALVGNAWTKERELGNVDMIRMTLLRPADLYVGKAVGGFVALMPVLLAMYAATIPAYILQHGVWFKLLLGQFAMLHSATVALLLSLYASFLSRRASTAIAAGSALCVLAFIGVWFAARLFLPSELSLVVPQLNRYLDGLSPVVAYAVWMERFSTVSGDINRAAADVAARTAWLYSMVGFTALAAAAAFLAIYRLRRKEMRDI